MVHRPRKGPRGDALARGQVRTSKKGPDMEKRTTSPTRPATAPRSAQIHEVRVELLKLRNKLTILERDAGDAGQHLEAAFAALVDVDDIIGEAHGAALAAEHDLPVAAGA